MAREKRSGRSSSASLSSRSQKAPKKHKFGVLHFVCVCVFVIVTIQLMRVRSLHHSSRPDIEFDTDLTSANMKAAAERELQDAHQFLLRVQKEKVDVDAKKKDAEAELATAKNFGERTRAEAEALKAAAETELKDARAKAVLIKEDAVRDASSPMVLAGSTRRQGRGR